MQDSMLEKNLKELIGKSVAITYVGPDMEESRVLGRLRNVSAEVLEIAGVMDNVVLFRKSIKLVEVHFLQSPAEADTMKLFIRKMSGDSISAELLRQIGLLIEQGKICAKDNPTGVEWELSNWEPILSKTGE